MDLGQILYLCISFQVNGQNTSQPQNHEWHRGRGSRGHGSSHGRGGGGGSSQRLSTSTITKSEDIFGESFSYSITRDLKEGRFSSFLVWLSDEGIEINQGRFDRIEELYRSKRIPKELYDGLEHETGGGGGARYKLTISEAGISELETILSTSFSRDVREAMREGDLQVLIEWLDRENIKLTSGQLRRISRLQRGNTISTDVEKYA